MQSQPSNQKHLEENFTLVQKTVTTFRRIHLLASGIMGAVHAFVPLRTFVSTVTIVISAFKFDIHTGAASLPAGGTIGVAIQPDRRLDDAGYKKRAGDCRECFHFTVVNLRPELARKQLYGHEDNWPEQISQGFVASERSIPTMHRSIYNSVPCLQIRG